MNIDYTDSRLYFNNFCNLDEWTEFADLDGIEVGLRFIYLNIRSIRKNWDAFNVQLALSNILYDVIVLSEVACDENEVSLYQLQGFNQYYSLRTNKGGGGLIVFINATNLTFTPNTSYKISTYEHITGELEKIGSKDPFKCLIHAVYRPPTSCSGIPLPQTLQDLDNMLSSINHSKNLIVMGDTNINLKNKTDQNVQRYETILASRGLERGIWDFTRE